MLRGRERGRGREGGGERERGGEGEEREGGEERERGGGGGERERGESIKSLNKMIFLETHWKSLGRGPGSLYLCRYGEMSVCVGMEKFLTGLEVESDFKKPACLGCR